MKISKSLTVLFTICATIALLNCGGGGGGSGGSEGGSTSSSPGASSVPPMTKKYPLPFSETPPPVLQASTMMLTLLDEGGAWGAYGIDAADWENTLTGLGRSAPYAAVSIAPSGSYYAFADQNSPDEEQTSLLFDRSGKSIGSGSGAPRWVSQTNQSDQYVWTADEKHLYYGVYYDGLYRIDTETGTSEQVVKSTDPANNESVFDHSIAVSPDNAYLVWFHHEWGKYANIYVIDPAKLPVDDYEKATRITPWLTKDGSIQDEAVYDEDTYPVFIDNRNMLFVFTTWNKVGSSTKLFNLNVETGIVDELITLSTGPAVSVSLSHDKSRLLVCGSTLVSIVDIAARYETIVDDLAGYSTNRAAAWSPDDQHFAVATLVDGGSRAEVLLYEPLAPTKWRLNQVSAGAVGNFTWVK